MNVGAYAQHQLAMQPPSGIEPTSTVVFEVKFCAEDGKICLCFNEQGTKGQDYLAIRKDTIVEIALVGDQLYFSKANDAITTKNELKFYYGGLEYDDYDEEHDRYKKVRFIARYNKGGKYGTVHAFNLNVDLLQHHNDETPHWITLTIDPDIQNPPPKV